MNIICWSDFNCPYSYIGLKRLSDATLEVGLDFKWEFKAFELEPRLSNNPSKSMLEHHMDKFNISKENALKDMADINSIASKTGLDINYSKVKLVSSRNAHRLVKYIANRKEDVIEVVFKIFEYNFSLNQNIADIEILSEIGQKFGFKKNEICDMLMSESNNIEVELDINDAMLYGISSIPHYIINIKNDELIIPGAFEKEDFIIALQDLSSGEIKSKTFI